MDYKHCQNKNYQLLYPGKKSYPKKFTGYFETVPIFLTLGHFPPERVEFPMTFVGSRRADELVLNWMDFYLPSLIREKKIHVVSGGARGVDQKAHVIAVRSQSPTLCFLPSGLDHFYPESLYSLKNGILDNGGAFISCFPPWVEMYKPYFSCQKHFYGGLLFIDAYPSIPNPERHNDHSTKIFGIWSSSGRVAGPGLIRPLDRKLAASL